MFYILVFLAYLMGSIPTGVLIGKHFFNTDIRKHGSKNIGSTNAFRVLGKKAGIIVLLIDILKGAIPTLLSVYFIHNYSPIIVGVFAILGHTFPLFANFKGGKAVATTAGVMIVVNPILIGLTITIFIATLYFFRMVSLSSIVSALAGVILSLFFNDLLLISVTFGLGILILYRHKSNISRILNGTENKVPFGFNYKKDH